MCIILEGCLLGPSATERPLGTIREEKGISSRFQVPISYTTEAVESDVKPYSVLPSF